jgi:hypothetical protein
MKVLNMSADIKRWRFEMKKSLISVLMIGLLTFGLVLVGCDNPSGGGGGDENKVVAEQYQGRYEYVDDFESIQNPDSTRWIEIAATTLKTTEITGAYNSDYEHRVWTESNPNGGAGALRLCLEGWNNDIIHGFVSYQGYTILNFQGKDYVKVN